MTIRRSNILCYFRVLVKRRMRRKLLILMIAIMKHVSLRPRMGSRRTPPKIPPKKPPKRSAPYSKPAASPRVLSPEVALR